MLYQKLLPDSRGVVVSIQLVLTTIMSIIFYSLLTYITYQYKNSKLKGIDGVTTDYITANQVNTTIYVSLQGIFLVCLIIWLVRGGAKKERYIDVVS
jgi:hypothetical protein